MNDMSSRAAARGPGVSSAVGTVLIAAGLLLLAYASLGYLGLVPGSRVTVPAPVALERAGGAREIGLTDSAEPAATVDSAQAAIVTSSAPAAGLSNSAEPVGVTGSVDAVGVTTAPAPPAAVPTPVVEPVGQAAEGPGAALVSASRPVAPAAAVAPAAPAPHPDADERSVRRPKPGLATRLAIPSIELETEVVKGGVVQNGGGEWEWETVPFVAAHYADDTAPVGARGNAVISGHVVTLREGNVFRNLYKVELGDEVEVGAETDASFRYKVVQVKLVPPTAVEVMAPTSDPTLTLITCGGTFDPRSRSFSDRLIVIAKLMQEPARGSDADAERGGVNVLDRNTR